MAPATRPISKLNLRRAALGCAHARRLALRFAAFGPLLGSLAWAQTPASPPAVGQAPPGPGQPSPGYGQPPPAGYGQSGYGQPPDRRYRQRDVVDEKAPAGDEGPFEEPVCCFLTLRIDPFGLLFKKITIEGEYAVSGPISVEFAPSYDLGVPGTTQSVIRPRGSS